MNTPQNTQTANLVGDFNVLGNAGAERHWFDTQRRSRSRRTSGSATRTRNQFYGPGGKNFDFSLFRSFPLGGRRIEPRSVNKRRTRVEVANLTNCVDVRAIRR